MSTACRSYCSSSSDQQGVHVIVKVIEDVKVIVTDDVLGCQRYVFYFYKICLNDAGETEFLLEIILIIIYVYTNTESLGFPWVLRSCSKVY